MLWLAGAADVPAFLAIARPECAQPHNQEESSRGRFLTSA
jgi:hypothetical protein